MNMQQTLDLRLTELKNLGAHNYDPICFCYIQSIVKRSIGKPSKISRLLEQKAIEALNTFQNRFEKACSKVPDIKDCISFHDPVSGVNKDDDFIRVEQFEKKNDHCCGQRAVSSLVCYINEHYSHLDSTESQPSIDDLLRKQEDEILQILENHPEGKERGQDEYHEELRSYRFFKASLERRQIDKRVNNVINERPDNPGPLNSQMLAIRILSTMRSLSPDYLNRFISYLDALFWLEHLK